MTKLCATIACQYTVGTCGCCDIVLSSRSPQIFVKCRYPLFANPLFKPAQFSGEVTTSTQHGDEIQINSAKVSRQMVFFDRKKICSVCVSIFASKELPTFLEVHRFQIEEGHFWPFLPRCSNSLNCEPKEGTEKTHQLLNLNFLPPTQILPLWAP